MNSNEDFIVGRNLIYTLDRLKLISFKMAKDLLEYYSLGDIHEISN